MGNICPKEGKSCIDDLCRGSGICGLTGHEMWDQCQKCHGIYSDEWGVECACEPDYDDYDDVENECRGCMGPCGRCHEALESPQSVVAVDPGEDSSTGKLPTREDKAL
jgi:hypothetical protein